MVWILMRTIFWLWQTMVENIWKYSAQRAETHSCVLSVLSRHQAMFISSLVPIQCMLQSTISMAYGNLNGRERGNHSIVKQSRLTQSTVFIHCSSTYYFFYFSMKTYSIWSNYHNVCLGFSKILGKLMVNYVPTYTIKVHLKKKKISAKDLKN